MKKIKLSVRDTDIMDKKYDPKDFDAEYKADFSNGANAINLATELYDMGYKTLASISQQFKNRNYDVNAEIKKVINAVIEKMELKNKPN